MAARKKKTAKKTSAKVNGANGPAAPAAPAISMTDEAVNQYLEMIAKGEVTLEGMEADVAEKFRACTHQSQQVNQAVQQMSAQLEQGRAQAQQLAGELKGYATLLVSAEDARRSETPKRKAKPAGDPNNQPEA